MQTIKNIIYALGAIAIFALGIFFEKQTAKPSAQIVNNYKKLKSKGRNNTIENTSNNTIEQDNSRKKEKRRFRLFKRKER